MKKILCALVFMCMAVSCAWGEVRIDATNFPDSNFRTYVSENFDKDRNGTLSNSEISAVTIIGVDSRDISSLKGIEHFTSLVGLNCRQNNLTELDMSANRYIMGVFCENNNIQSINLGGKISLIALVCSNNEIASLNIENCTQLVSVDCSNNKLKSLSLKGLKSLRSLECRNQGQKTGNVFANDGITELYRNAQEGFHLFRWEMN